MKDRLHIKAVIAEYKLGGGTLDSAADSIMKMQSKSTRFNLNSFVLGFAGGFILFIVTALILHGNNLI